MQQPMPNPEDITDPTTAMNMALALMAKAFKLNYSTPTNNNQRISSNPRNRQIAQPGMNNGLDRTDAGWLELMGESGVFQFIGNQNGQIGVQNIGNGNVVAARAEGNAPGNNGNQIRCYNCRGLGHLARNCTVRPRRSKHRHRGTRWSTLRLDYRTDQLSNVFDTSNAPKTDSEASSSNSVNIDVTPNNQLPHVQKWTQAHPLANIIGDKKLTFYHPAQMDFKIMLVDYGDVLKNKALVSGERISSGSWLEVKTLPHGEQNAVVYGIQAKPTEMNLSCFKRIFRYRLKEHSMGLWVYRRNRL
ncbi:gag-pol polyprotein [Tanacetum coccineum]